MPLEATNLKPKKFKYVALAKKNYFTKINTVGKFTHPYA